MNETFLLLAYSWSNVYKHLTGTAFSNKQLSNNILNVGELVVSYMVVAAQLLLAVVLIKVL
jgi:hypothetical protein